MRNIRGVAFDFDGVLVGIDTHSRARIAAFEEFAKEHSDARFLASAETHDLAHEHGSHPAEIIGWVLKQQGIIPTDSDVTTDPMVTSVVKRKTVKYHNMVSEGLDALPHAVETVIWAAEQFGAEHVSIATTASRIREVDPFLARYDLQSRVGVIRAKEDTPSDQTKPHPYVYEAAAEAMGLDPAEIVAIEDSVRGIQSARAAGMQTIGVLTTHSAEQLRPYADLIALGMPAAHLYLTNM